MNRDKHIIFCDCGGERIPAEKKIAVENVLKNTVAGYSKISDLCGIAAVRKDLVAQLTHDNTDILIIGCYKRTMDLLFKQAAMDHLTQSSGHINLIEQSAEEAEEKISVFFSNSKGLGESRQIREDSGWPSWYPVIDYDRCTQCGQCSDFCLFGVFEKTNNQVRVVNPRGCKNNCPACARICPSAAIIFPKYTLGGAIGGSDEIDEQAEQQRQANDIGQILGDDIYMALERRRARRKSIIREEMLLKAIAEREQALGESNKNQERVDIQ